MIHICCCCRCNNVFTDIIVTNDAMNPRNFLRHQSDQHLLMNINIKNDNQRIDLLFMGGFMCMCSMVGVHLFIQFVLSLFFCKMENLQDPFFLSQLFTLKKSEKLRIWTWLLPSDDCRTSASHRRKNSINTVCRSVYFLSNKTTLDWNKPNQ